MIRQLSNGQWYSPESGLFWDSCPFIQGKTMMTKAHGLIPFFDDGSNIFAMPIFCEKIEKRGKYELVEGLIIKGNVKINGNWQKIEHDLKPLNAYILLIERINNEKFIKKYFLIKK